MKWFRFHREDYISSRIRAIDSRLSVIDREIRSLGRLLSGSRPRKKKPVGMVTRHIASPVLPDSKKRFVSYLSTGSFQTIGLRRHEQKSAKLKTIIAGLAVVIFVFYVIYFFVKWMSA